MPVQKRHKTKYPGVYYINGTSLREKRERIYYIYYRKNGKIITEKAGRQYQDDMTPARAAHIRSLRISGKELSNKERRQEEEELKQAQANRWTVSMLWEEYKKLNVIKGLTTDNNRFQKYLKDPFGDKEPHELIVLDIDRLRIKLSKKLKPQTVKHVLALLRRIVNFGADKGICEGITFKIKLPDVNNRRTDNLTSDELNRLLMAVDKDENKQVGNLIKLALYTGMRRGEMFKLKWKDIDFERGFISINDPKGGPDQKIPLNDETRKLLQSHEKTDSPYVFPGEGGGQRVTAQKALRRIRERAGLAKDFRPLHGLRHVYASMLASSGKVDMYTLQKLLTHKDPRMTQRYAHLRDETLRQASNLAGELIKQSMKGKVVEIEK